MTVGDELTYTLHFTNIGTGPVDVAREDDLSGVLDDAALTSGPTSSDPALQVSGPDGDQRIQVSGTLAPDQTATVTYTVRVKKNGGDDQLGNFLVDPGEDPPPHCNVPDGARAAELSDCTENPVSAIEAVKDVNLPHDSQVQRRRRADVHAEVHQHRPRGRRGGLHRPGRRRPRRRCVGARAGELRPGPGRRTQGQPAADHRHLAAGQTVRVTYDVRVKPDGQRGNDQLNNYLFPDGAVSPISLRQGP